MKLGEKYKIRPGIRNQVIITGKFHWKTPLYEIVNGQSAYRNRIKSVRKSENIDEITICADKDIFPELIDVNKNYIVFGEIFTKNIENGKRLTFVKANSICEDNKPKHYDKNKIFIDGYLEKDVIFRTTPSGIPIVDLYVRAYLGGQPYIILCIAWDDNARNLGKYKKDAHIKLVGRLQSRKYKKAGKVKTTNEVSIEAYE